MADYGLNKNHEGYADPTAFEAIRGMAKPGEIWMYKGRECLVIKNHGKFCNILQLGTYKKDSTEVGGLYAQPGMISYAFSDLLTECVGKISTESLNEVLKAVEYALSMTFVKEADSMAIPAPDPAATAEIECLKSECDALRMRYKEADSMAAKFCEEFKNADKEAEKLRIQLGLMKEMYADLMNKFLQGA